jgi:hypothetical protein
LVKVFNIDGFKVPVDIDNNCDGDSSLRSCDCDHDQAEKMAMKQVWIKKLVENHKINIHGIEDQFDRHQHGNQISSCQEAVDANEEHQGTDNKK